MASSFYLFLYLSYSLICRPPCRDLWRMEEVVVRYTQLNIHQPNTLKSLICVGFFLFENTIMMVTYYNSRISYNASILIYLQHIDFYTIHLLSFDLYTIHLLPFDYLEWLIRLNIVIRYLVRFIMMYTFKISNLYKNYLYNWKY